MKCFGSCLDDRKKISVQPVHVRNGQTMCRILINDEPARRDQLSRFTACELEGCRSVDVTMDKEHRYVDRAKIRAEISLRERTMQIQHHFERALIEDHPRPPVQDFSGDGILLCSKESGRRFGDLMRTIAAQV